MCREKKYSVFARFEILQSADKRFNLRSRQSLLLNIVQSQWRNLFFLTYKCTFCFQFLTCFEFFLLRHTFCSLLFFSCFSSAVHFSVDSALNLIILPLNYGFTYTRFVIVLHFSVLLEVVFDFHIKLWSLRSFEENVFRISIRWTNPNEWFFEGKKPRKSNKKTTLVSNVNDVLSYCC